MGDGRVVRAGKSIHIPGPIRHEAHVTFSAHVFQLIISQLLEQSVFIRGVEVELRRMQIHAKHSLLR